MQLPPVRLSEEPWTRAELAEVRRELTRSAAELRRQVESAEAAMLARHQDGGGEGSGDDQADVGNQTFEREQEMSLAQNSRNLLAQVQHALSRLASGTYAVCESCGDPIGKARLQAFPRATSCVACKAREERR